MLLNGRVGGQREPVFLDGGDDGEARASAPVKQGHPLAGSDAQDGLEVSGLVASERTCVGEQLVGLDEAAVHTFPYFAVCLRRASRRA